MATENLIPTGDGTLAEHEIFAGSTRYENIDDAVGSPDEDTTYVFSSVGGGAGLKRDLYTLPANSIPVGSTITNVRVVIRAKGRSAAKGGTTTIPLKAIIRENSTNTESSSQNTTGSYVDYNFDFATRPSDNGAWTIADITSLEAGPSDTCPGASDIRITQAYVIVTYTPPPSYEHISKIEIDYTKVINETHTDFPFLVSGTYPYLKTVANGGKVQNANGYDIAFYSDLALTTQLKHEVERYVATTGEVVYRVKIPSLSHTENTVIYMAYSNAGITTDQSDKVNVWDSNSSGVWHLGDGTTLSALDSTGVNDGTISNATAIAGKIDGGASFNNTDKKITVTDHASISPTAAITISCWFNATTLTDNADDLIWKSNSYGFSYGLTVVGATSGKMGFLFLGGGTWRKVSLATNVSTGTWYYLAGTFDGTTLRIYLNGDQDNTALYTGTINDSTNALVMGANDISSRWYNGGLDEVRISSTARSAGWIKTEYNNQSSPSTFYSITSGFIAGTSDGTSTASGSLVGTGNMAGASSGSAITTASLNGLANLAATSAGSSTTSGTLIGAGNISATSDGAATVSGTLIGSGGISGTASGSSIISAQITGDSGLTGINNGSSTSCGTISGAGELYGSIQAASTTVAILTGSVQTIYVIAGTSTAEGTLTGTGELTGTANGTARTTANIHGAAVITGETNGSSQTNGVLGGQGNIAVSINGSSTTLATIQAAGVISGIINGTCFINAPLQLQVNIQAATSGASSVIAKMYLSIPYYPIDCAQSITIYLKESISVNVIVDSENTCNKIIINSNT